MHRLRSALALLLLALWLPATLHCEMEAASNAWNSFHCAQTEAHDHNHGAAPENCSTDNCATVEGGFTVSSSAQTSLRAPIFCATPFVALILVPTLAAASPPAEGVIEARAAPPEVNCRWVFTTRAAPLPGAPALS